MNLDHNASNVFKQVMFFIKVDASISINWIQIVKDLQVKDIVRDV